MTDPLPTKPARPGALTIFLAVLLGLALAAGGGALAAFSWYERETSAPGPTAGAEEPVVIVLERGRGLRTIADDLEVAGVLERAWLFQLLVRAEGAEASLKAGEYAFEPGASLRDILGKLRSGDIVRHAITIPEGLTSARIVALVAADQRLTGETPEVPPEGSLAPETYQILRGDDRTELVRRMRRAQDDLLTELWPTRDPNLPLADAYEVLILASIVEKETGLDGERPRVASVFVNRINRGMRLESDPTVVYGLTAGEPLGRGLRRSELDGVTAYNTYQIDGLPPTPIANPGRAAIEAVLNPPQTNDMFFVADGTGGHAFAETYREHRRNVAAWRAIERARRAEQASGGGG